MTAGLSISRVLVLGLLAGGCASSPFVPSSPWGGISLERSAGKQEDDLRIAELSKPEMAFEMVVFPSSDGLEIPAYLFRPLDLTFDATGEPRPAVIYLHGGEHGTFSSRAIERVLPLVGKGWVVLAPDYRGSSGYGARFHDAVDYGGREIDDVLAARDWLVESGHAAEGQIAVLGASHGGYNALMAVARRPDGFAACVDFYGPTDLVYRVTSTPEENPNASPGDPEKFERMVGATVEEDEQAYWDRSPRFLADRIQAPVLIIHGTDDGVVQVKESEWLVEALGAADHPDFFFIQVEGGKHGYPAEAYGPAWEQVLSFLEQRFQSRSQNALPGD